MSEYRIFIPTGLPDHLTAIVENIPDGCEIVWNNTKYQDGHQEGTITFPSGEVFSLEAS